MTVHFIGAGPGAADLLTIRGQRLIASCQVCVFAGALVPDEVLSHAPKEARLIDSQHLTLEQIIEHLRVATAEGHEVARLHSGDLSVYSAFSEQTRELDRLGIDWTITPGVPAFASAAADLGTELTRPGVAQSLILTRFSRRATALPPGEELSALAAHGTTLVLYLGAQAIEEISVELAQHYGKDCPVAVVARSSWPDSRVVRGTLATIAGPVLAAGIKRTATIIVGPVLADTEHCRSHLYSANRERNVSTENAAR